MKTKAENNKFEVKQYHAIQRNLTKNTIHPATPRNLTKKPNQEYNDILQHQET
jgi:hypothetical protein